MENGKLFNILGWVAMAASISMYVSYIPQISDNLAGHKGNPIQPLVSHTLPKFLARVARNFGKVENTYYILRQILTLKK